MKSYVLLYDGFVQFEIILSLLLLKDKSEIHTFSVDERVVSSHERIKAKADLLLEDVDPDNVDLLIIPGGEPGIYKERKDINTLLQDIHLRGKPIAAICGGPEFLANAGILKDKRITHGHDEEYALKVFTDCALVDEDVVIDGNIITARGQAFAEFAVEICRQLDLFESEKEAEETLRWFKNMA
ncbi:MAG: DJ-1/PfpI family protein [Candidatus Thorarchaeota archaeon]|jgi:putative intracellular protease/amidase